MRLFKKRLPPVGSAPGTIASSTSSAEAVVRLTLYGGDDHAVRELGSVSELGNIDWVGSQVAWLDVEGLEDEEWLRAITAQFTLHPLLLEDVVNVPQRPHVAEYGDALCVVSRMLRYHAETGLDVEQVSFVLHGNVLITFQERSGDVFDPVRRRIEAGTGRLRSHGADYLLYALLDAVVDAYFPALEAIGEQLETLEDTVLSQPNPDELRKITHLKSELLAMRRSIWPQRESLSVLVRDDYDAIDSALQVYFRDVQDHAVQSADVVESYRELASGLQNTYLTVVANRTNDIMRVLTIIASIFIPLTFLAGIYGMNFENMPELKFAYGYPILVAVMISLGVGLGFWFRRKRWL